MTFRVIKANLLDEIDKAKTDILIPHVCNNKYVMGAGIAYQLAKRYPNVLEIYRRGKPSLGETQFVIAETGSYSYGPWKVVANMVAQTLYENDEVPLKYEHLVSCMQKVREYCFKQLKIMQIPVKILTIPFGSGLAGGNRQLIDILIKEMWVDCGIDVTVCEL